MKRTADETAALKKRVRAVREKFESRPKFKWLPTFRDEHPCHTRHKIRNVFYGNSADEQITNDLELFWVKYEQQTK